MTDLVPRVLLVGVACLLFLAGCLRGVRDGRTASTRADSIGSDARFPERWIAGLDCESDPPLQVHHFDEGFVIIRQSKCLHYEAPFMYLLLGSETAVLFDTGSPGNPPLLDAVGREIETWKETRGLDELELIVAHTHAHFDHVFNDRVFADRPGTTLVGPRLDDVTTFWGIDEWPEGTASFDLGGRVIDIIPTPGHEPSHISIYDRATEVLITGDTFYPGYLFVFSALDWHHFRDSTRRLLEFADTHPVRWLLGCHIEISRTGESYAYGAGGHVDERPLQLEVSHLRTLAAALEAMGEEPVVQNHLDFVIMPVWVADFF